MRDNGDAGFKKVSGANIHDRTLEDTTYFNPKNGYVIGDAKPDNFKRIADKRIVPIDLMVALAAPGSALHKAMSAGIK